MKDVKICKACNKELTFDNFWKQPNNKDGYFGKCKTCALILVDTNHLNKQTLLEKNIWTCISCKQSLPLNKENFHSDITTSTKFKTRCKECSKKSRLSFTRMTESNSLDYYLKEIIHGARGRAKKKNLDFELSLELIKSLWSIQDGKCAITKIPMTHIILQGRLQTNLSIDRIDSSIGYVVNNIQLVCVAVNIMKSTLSMEELINFCKLIINNNE
jgi:hypothetical protein